MMGTAEIYADLHRAYDFFNKELFDGELPTQAITLQRKKHAYGYFSPKRFAVVDDERTMDEIALNPDTFKGRTRLDIFATLVHEMCHTWQATYGAKGGPSNGYHDSEWADKMMGVGLQPIALDKNGEANGKMTGRRLHHEVMPYGGFAIGFKAYVDLYGEAEYDIYSLVDPAKVREAKKKNKVAYTCPDCGSKAWGKPGLNLVCGEDSAVYIPEEQEGGDDLEGSDEHDGE